MTSFLQDLVKAKFLLKRAQTLIDAGLENVILITVFCLDLVQVDLIFCPFKPEAGAFIQECEKDLLEMILLSRNFAVIFVSPPTPFFISWAPAFLPFLSISLSLFQLITLPTEFLPSTHKSLPQVNLSLDCISVAHTLGLKAIRLRITLGISYYFQPSVPSLILHSPPPFVMALNHSNYYSYLRFKSYKLENALQKKHCSEPNIEAI